MAAKRHLHRDYGTTHCGLDASHILMTYEPGESDCADCIKSALAAHEEEDRLASVFAQAAAALGAREEAEAQQMAFEPSPGDEAAIAEVAAIVIERERQHQALAAQHAAEAAQKRSAHVENLRAQLNRISQ